MWPLILALISSFYLFGCSTAGYVKMNPELEYQRDLVYEVEYWDEKKKAWSQKLKYVGVGVVPRASKYRVTLYAVGKADIMVLTSCHRQIPVTSQKARWFTKGHTFEFSPSEELETNSPCAIEMAVLEKKKGKHGWAYLVIAHATANLPSETKCNGSQQKWHGTSFCQAKAGLLQEISFDRTMGVTYYGNCKLGPVSGDLWRYKIPRSLCILSFIDDQDERNSHVHYMFGYDRLPMR